ncbi:unnamed protein product, partial [Ixodes persulcatus]
VVRVTQFLWERQRDLLPDNLQGQPGVKGNVVFLGGATVPAVVMNILEKGPKFDTEPSVRPSEMLALVRQAGASLGPQPYESDSRLVTAVAAHRPAPSPVISYGRRPPGCDDVSAFSHCPDGRLAPSRRDSASSTDSYASWTAGQAVAQQPRRYESRQVGSTLPRGRQLQRRSSTGDAYETPRYENLAFHRSLKGNAVATLRPRGGRRTYRVSGAPQHEDSVHGGN